MAQGWVIMWLPPVNKSVAVAYYRIEYKEDDGRWQYSEPIAKDTAYLRENHCTYEHCTYWLILLSVTTVKNLETGIKYTFRVWAYSILGNGEVSEPLEYKIPGKNSISIPLLVDICVQLIHLY